MRLMPLLIVLMFMGCAKKEEKRIDQVIRINVLGEPSSLHPHLGVDNYCRCLQKALFEGLTRENPQGITELAAAENVVISDDLLCYTFFLRDSQWSNGEKVTASHFVNAWKKAISKGSNCLRADLFYIIKNAQKVKKGELPIDKLGLHIIDERTLLVELAHPAPYFLDLISNPLFFPLYDDSESPPFFNGPFCIDFWQRNKELSLKTNSSYWDKKNIRIQGINITMVPDHYTAFLMFEKGEIDWVGRPFSNIPLDAIPELQKEGKILSQEIAGVYWLSCNTKTVPLNSSKMRKALACAINRGELAHHVLQGEIPTRSVQPPHLQLIREHELYPDGNVDAAQNLFNEALEELQMTKEELPALEFNYSDVPGQKAMVQAIASEWEKIFNIKIDLVGTDWNTFFNNLGERKFQMGGCIWFFLYNDPAYALEFFKEKNNRYNAPQWENERYKQLLTKADNETNIEKRKQYLKEAEQILLDEMPIIPIFVLNNRYMTHPHLKGVFTSDLGDVDFKWAYLDGNLSQ